MIGQVMICVSTIEKARKFYIEDLGLEIENDLSQQMGMLIMKNEGCYFTIHEGYKPVPVEWESCRTSIILKVKDIENSRIELKKKDVNLIGEIEETPVHRFQAMKDLDGNIVEIAEFK
jgi:predicted enzyme related to lactoylglutathione lyase